jgi:hypothetical protein
VGRVHEVGLIRDLLHGDRCAGLPRAVAVHGPAGVGKSALACVAAHAVAGEYPDGQLYVDLSGAADPARVLARLLRSLQPHGGPPAGDVREASARYRSLVADKRMLVVLDNAGSDEQVEPLLPAGGGCGVIVTSRAVLRGIDDARRLMLRPLTEESGRELLSRYAGAQRLAAEPDTAQDLLHRCGGLPGALRNAAGQLVHGSRA